MEKNYIVLVDNGFGWQLYKEELYGFEEAENIAKRWCEKEASYKAKLVQEISRYGYPIKEVQ